jgi:DMSO/TMAO reductase YedYZ molybdopterin-dependent catalytic subunit
MNTPEPLPPEIDPAAPRAQRDPAPRWAGPLAGLLAAIAGVAAGQLSASILDVVSPLGAVGSEFIDRTPPWLKQWAIDVFGVNDKAALRVGIFVTIAALALAAGAVARRRPVVGPAVMIVFGGLGALVAVGRPGEPGAAGVPGLVAAIVGAIVVWTLIRLVGRHDPAELPGSSRASTGWDRRRFVTASGAIAAGTVVTFGAARTLERRRIDQIADDAPAVIPVAEGEVDNGLGGTVSADAPEIPASATVSPVTPFVTPNEDFYLIDTALSIPRVRLDRWTLDIAGRVDNPLSLTYDDLLARPQVERVITIACVSNEVGGQLIGNAVWQGVLLADLLDEAGVRPDAEQVFGTSVDGWTCGFPVEAAVDGRDAMIALGMNGERLPLKHGFPARVIIPGLYGYVSATKWVRKLELTTWDEAVGYWIPRGWARDAPIKTQSRIDVPRRNEELAVGTTTIAGIAWAQRRGITKVEVRIDEGDWQEADLATDVSVDAWRQWKLAWDATEGEHTIRVRATDANGDTQTDEVTRPDPDGATGHHTRLVRVRT